MNDFKIISITKLPFHHDPLAAISSICCCKSQQTLLGETIEHFSQIDAIKMIENKQATFFVEEKQKKVKVIVNQSRWGNKYIRTENDGEEQNNLLSLPPCSHPQ